MKRLFDSTWFAALKRWRAPRRVDPDAGDMGTAFGLDSITVVDFDTTVAQSGFSNSAMNATLVPATGAWLDGVTR